MKGNIKYFLLSTCIIFCSLEVIAICAYTPDNLIEYLHERKNTTIFTARIDSNWITAGGAYVSRATVMDIFLGKIDSQQVLIYSGNDNIMCPGGSRLNSQKMYIFVSSEFKPGCFSAFVCDKHSKIIDNSEESNNLLDLALKIRQAYSKGLKGRVDFFLGNRKLASGKYKNGKPNGNWKYYHKEIDFLCSEVHYTMGVKTGVEKRYGEYGLSTWCRYDNDGTILEVRNYNGKNKLLQHSINRIPVEDFTASEYYKYRNVGEAVDTMRSLTVKGLEVRSYYHGRYVEYTDDGELIARGNYYRGAKTGPWYQKRKYGKEPGTYRMYSPEMKRYDGYFFWYNEDGSLGTLFIPDSGWWAGRVTTGAMIGFKTNGDTSFIYRFKDGKKTGKSISYHENVNLISSITNYNNGQIDGEFTNFHASPHVIASHGYYFNGMNKKGLWEHFYPNGRLQASELYNDDGKLTGKRTGFYENGQLKDSVTYVNGLQEGLYTAYYNNGNLRESGRYEEGFKTGKWLYFNEDETLRKTWLFTKSEQHEPDALIIKQGNRSFEN